MIDELFIIKRIKEGDVGQFEKIFRHYYTPLCMYAFSITGRKDIAEEIIQELFYKIWKDREQLSIYSSLKNYLYGAVKNQSLQYLEHLSVHRKYEENRLNCGDETDLSPQELLEYQELEELVTTILKKMPERRRRIFLLHRMEGKKQKVIADMLSISLKTVEAEMTKAYRTLRQELRTFAAPAVTKNYGKL